MKVEMGVNSTILSNVHQRRTRELKVIVRSIQRQCCEVVQVPVRCHKNVAIPYYGNLINQRISGTQKLAGSVLNLTVQLQLPVGTQAPDGKRELL